MPKPLAALPLAVPLLALGGMASMVLGFHREGAGVAALLLVVPAVAALGLRTAQRASGAIVFASAALGYALPLAWACASASSQPIVGPPSATVPTPIVALVAIGLSAAFGALGAGVAHGAARPIVERALRVAAGMTIASLVVATAVGATHSGRESPASFLQSLDATPIANQTGPLARVYAWDGSPVTIHGATFVTQHRVGEGVEHIEPRPPFASTRSCALAIARHGDERIHPIRFFADAEDACPSVRVRYVPDYRGHDAFVVEQGRGATFDPLLAIDGDTLERVTLVPEDVGAELGPPTSWRIGSMIAAAIALLFFVASARRRPLPVVMEGEHVGSGWVRFQDSAPRFVSHLTREIAGPVLAIGAPGGETYRIDGGVPTHARIVKGTRASFEQDALRARAAFSCLALATATLALAPLVASVMSGTSF